MSYGPFVPVYALLANLYSGGAIPACHRWAVDQLNPGDNVLFAGAGPGTDVVRAALAGLQVTAVEICPAMLDCARRRARNAGVEASVRFVEGDVLEMQAAAAFDAVIAQFFLNVFSKSSLPGTLAALAGHLSARGRLLVGDFAPLPGSARVWQQLWHDVPMHVLARTGANAVHPVHDLPRHLRAAGFDIDERQPFRLFGNGPAWIEGLVARQTVT